MVGERVERIGDRNLVSPYYTAYNLLTNGDLVISVMVKDGGNR